MLRADSLRVVFWPDQRAVARRTLQAARTPFPFPGIPSPQTTGVGTIVLAPTPALFDSLTGGRAPEWSAGVAIPRRRLIILPSYPSPHTRPGDPAITLRHELAHLMLNAYLPGRIPRWFDEGYATWASGGWDAASAWQLRLALLLGRAPPLDSLNLGWPRGAERARLAYLLSASAVHQLSARGGEEGFAALLEAWRREGSLDAALRVTYGMTLGQFEKEWRQAVRRRYGWLLAFSQAGLFWLLVTILFVLLGSRRRRHDRERMAQLEAEDWMLPPASEPGLDGEEREG